MPTSSSARPLNHAVLRYLRSKVKLELVEKCSRRTVNSCNFRRKVNKAFNTFVRHKIDSLEYFLKCRSTSRLRMTRSWDLYNEQYAITVADSVEYPTMPQSFQDGGCVDGCMVHKHWIGVVLSDEAFGFQCHRPTWSLFCFIRHNKPPEGIANILASTFLSGSAIRIH